MRWTDRLFCRSWLFYLLVSAGAVSAWSGIASAEEIELKPPMLPPLEQVEQLVIETGLTGPLRLVGSEARKQSRTGEL